MAVLYPSARGVRYQSRVEDVLLFSKNAADAPLCPFIRKESGTEKASIEGSNESYEGSSSIASTKSMSLRIGGDYVTQARFPE
jgi:hypothetical protein